MPRRQRAKGAQKQRHAVKGEAEEQRGPASSRRDGAKSDSRVGATQLAQKLATEEEDFMRRRYTYRQVIYDYVFRTQVHIPLARHPIALPIRQQIQPGWSGHSTLKPTTGGLSSSVVHLCRSLEFLASYIRQSPRVCASQLDCATFCMQHIMQNLF